MLVVSAGYFGERWAAIAKAYGAEVDHLRYAWGEIPVGRRRAPRASREREATVVFFTHSETSTGVVADPQPFAAAAREAGALSVVDAVSSLGAVPLETDAWGIDVVASGAQKALMTPPGLAMVSALRPRGRGPPTRRSPRFYWDWERTRKGQATLDAPVTPPVSLVAGLDVALGMLLDEGLEARLRPPPPARPRLPRGRRRRWASSSSRPTTTARRSSPRCARPRASTPASSCCCCATGYGVTLAPGQGELKGKIFRIGHIGYYDVFDITTALAAVELALVELGAEIERGVAVTRALEAFEHTPGVTRARVLVREQIADAGVELLRERFDVDVDANGDLAATIGDYDAIVIRSATKLTAELIERAERLKVIGRAGVGVDNVDVEAATRRGIVVANAPESTVTSAAEHTSACSSRSRATSRRRTRR